MGEKGRPELTKHAYEMPPPPVMDSQYIVLLRPDKASLCVAVQS